jgi:hypothetical protein
MSKTLTVAEIIELCNTIQPTWCDLEHVSEDLGINSRDIQYPQNDDILLTARPFDTWTCWDTPVGRSLIYFGEMPVAIEVREFRKSDPEYYWLGTTEIYQTRGYLQSLLPKWEPNLLMIGPETAVPIEGEDIGDSRSAWGWNKKQG